MIPKRKAEGGLLARQRPLQPLQEKKKLPCFSCSSGKGQRAADHFLCEKKSGNDFSFKKKIHRDIKLTPKSKAFELILNELHYLSVKSGYSDCCIFKCASNQTSKIEIRPKINTKRVIKKKGKNKRPEI